MPEQVSHADIMKLTVDIVSAHVANNALISAELPQLIADVHATLALVGTAVEAPALARPPVVPIKQSVTPDYIICLEDGRKLKMLKRHLRTAYNLSPEQYKERWGLPADYPLVAPNYAKRRSDLARKIGLGRTGRTRS